MEFSGLRLTETEYLPDSILEEHSHSHSYLYFVRSGFYHEDVDGRRYLCEPRTVAVHPAGETHSERFHHQQTRSFNIEGCEMLPERCRETGGAMAHIASRAYESFLDGDCEATEGLVYELLGAVRGEVVECRDEPSWLMKARNRMEEILDKPVPMTSIAESLGVKATHLATAFRRFHRCTPGEYMRKLRIEAACRQIARGRDLSSVALECGFCDQAHFTKTFRRSMGVTPGQYKNLL